MRGKRESLQVIHDILQAVQDRNGAIKPTHIMYKANLSHQMLKEYLGELLERGFLEEYTGKGKKKKSGTKTYSLTQKGFDYLREFSTIERFMTSFGLDEQQE